MLSKLSRREADSEFFKNKYLQRMCLMSPCTCPNRKFIIICPGNQSLAEFLEVKIQKHGEANSCFCSSPSPPHPPGAYSESQHLVVLGIHGFAFFCSTARDGVAVRLCIKCNSSQLKYDVSLCLRDRREGNGNM